MHSDVGVLERTAGIQGRTQREDTQRLVLRADIQIEPLLLQAHRAIESDDGVFGFEHEGARLHQTILHREIRHQTLEHHLLISEQLDEDHVRHVQAGRFDEKAADRATRKGQAKLPVGRTQQGRHGVTGAGQLRISVQLTEAGIHGFRTGKQLLELQAAYRRGHFGLQRLVAPVDGQPVRQCAARHSEVHRLECQHAVLQAHVHGNVVERQVFLAQNALAFEPHIGIHEIPGFAADTCHRKRLAGGLLAPLFIVFGTHTDQGPQVTQAQLIGRHLARQHGPRRPDLVLQGAAQVALTHHTREVFVAPRIVAVQISDEAPLCAKRR